MSVHFSSFCGLRASTAFPCRPTLLATVILAALGGNAAAEEDHDLADVVVSAAKIEQSTAEAPSNVSVVTAEKIQNSNATRLGDALVAQVPSLYMRGGALGTTTRTVTSIVSLRGAYGGRTKVVVDGVASLADANSSNLNLSTVGLNDIARVEVIPGVSSSLYGSDAIGGVINVITKAPTRREFNASTTQGSGDGALQRYELSYRDRFENGLGISLGYYRHEMEGYAKSDFLTVAPATACGTCTTTTSGWQKGQSNTGATQYIIGDKGAVPSLAQNANMTLYYDFSPTSRGKAGISYFEDHSGHSPYNLYLRNAAGGPIGLPATNLGIDGRRQASLSEASLALPGDNYRTEIRTFAGYEGRIGTDYRIKLDVSRFDRDYYYLSKGTTAATTYNGGPGTATHAPNVAQDIQGQLSFPVGENHFIVTGLAFNTGELNRRVYSVGNWRDDRSKGAVTDSGNGNTRTYSLFAQDQYSITPATTLYLGARYDNWSTWGSIDKPGGVTPHTDVREHSYQAVSPRAALVHLLSDTVSLKASTGRAFRAPTLYDLYSADTVSGVKLSKSDFDLKPERAKSWDIGTEIALPNKGVFRAAYFETVISDMIYSKETAYTGPYTATIPTSVNILSVKTNAAEGRTKGIELSGEMNLASWLRANASYTYTDARITKDNSGTGLLDKKLVYVPKNMAALGFEAQYQGWTANWLSRYSGLTYVNATNSDIEKNVYGGTSKYWLSDLKVSYQFDKRLKASLLVNNVFDKKYYEYYLMPGRNVAVQLSGTF
ncbi:MAG TPA: TonB-dependent receptor [Rhodocyclaceae bacterium]|nr:TonB-dependent receptor [Rhodocyclaceae bacterium]